MGDRDTLLMPESSKLSGKNYTIWKFKMKNLLLMKELWQITIGEDERPVMFRSPTKDMTPIKEEASTSDEITQPSYEDFLVSRNEWDRRATRALCMINMSVQDHIIPHIASTTKPSEAWSILQKMFEATNVTRVLFLKQSLLTLKMSENESVQPFLTKVKEVCEQLAAVNEPVSEVDIMSVVMNALPSTYRYLVTTLMVREKQLTFDEFSGILLQEELMRKGYSKDTKSQDQALMARSTSSRGRGRKQGRGRGRNYDSSKNSAQQQGEHKGENSTNSFGTQMNKKKGPCFYCAKEGHHQNECRIKQAAANIKGKGKGSYSKNDKFNKQSDKQESDSSNFAREESDKEECSFMAFESKSGQDVWYLDSGASSHMTSHREWMTDFENDSNKNKVILGDNSTHNIEGVGNVKIQLTSGRSANIKNALLVPNLAKNLLSVGCLADQGFKMEFFKDKFFVKDVNDCFKIVAKGSRCDDKLYMLEAES